MSTPRRAPDVVGVTEVAAMAGVARSTVATWAARGTDDMPPAAALAAGKIWRRADILAWLVSTDRLANTARIH